MKAVVAALEALHGRALAHVRGLVERDGRADGALLERHQLAAHALAYVGTELEACRALSAWADRTGGAHERAIASAYAAEVVRALPGGVDLGPCEHVGPAEIGLDAPALGGVTDSPDVTRFVREHGTGDALIELARASRDRGTGDRGYESSELAEMQREMARFADAEVIPIAQRIHLDDVLIPIELVERMSELGVFGLTVPEAHGGLGLGKVAMCVVTEELTRGYIGVGSLGTRSEIACDLILGAGTDAQKARFLPAIASGEILPTAVFTEPNFGSDLAHIATRADRQPDGSYRVHGQKTWITHAARADLMTLLARTNPAEPGYEGLSMFLAEKTRRDPAPGEPPVIDAGLSATEIPVLGYRGMKEYELSFDGFALPNDALLGGVEGAGFKQLMRTFESARIQTAARGVGLAQAALDDAMRYATERVQFGKPIFELPRVARKIGRMVARTQAARQLAFRAARRKDSGDRCDLEAGMAKLLATRAAWEAADANVQIHGGNGYAMEYLASRLLVDARVLSIFEGANEIQAHVVARRMLE